MRGLGTRVEGIENGMLKLNKFAAFGAMAATLVLAGCRQDMHDQPKFIPQRGSDFYADGRSVRPQVANTLARNQLHEDSYFYTGMNAGKEVDALPFPVTMQVLERGQERFNVYCTPCHSRVGNGGGMIVQRGYSPAGDLTGDRLSAAPLGHFFHVMTNGYGSMPDYSAQVTPEDRWAIAAFLRALQLSQNAKRSDVSPGAVVMPLSSIAEAEGLPASFAEDWNVAAPAPIPGSTTSSGGAVTPGATIAPTAAGTPVSQNGAAPAAAAPKVDMKAMVQEGKAIYAANCVACHTAQLVGRPPVFPSLIGVVGRIGSAKVEQTVHNGHPPMPAFTALSPEQLDALVAYLSQAGKAPASEKQ
jgi:mono/diheme cytochrome c family protein